MKRRIWIALVVLLALVLLTFGVSRAAPSIFSLPWFTVDGGGSRLTGGNYTLESSIGQPDAGILSGGAYTLSGGFQLAQEGEVEYKVFLPLVVR